MSIGRTNAVSTSTDLSATTATAADVRTGKYFYNSDGSLTQGTIQNQSAQTIMPTTSDQTIASGKYLSGVQTIKGDANLLANNIKSGTSIFGVLGTYSGGGGSGGPFDLVKVTTYVPAEPAFTAPSSVVISGLTTIESWGGEEDISDYNGTYNVTSDTQRQSTLKRRIYKHSVNNYYLYCYIEDSYTESWCLGDDPTSQRYEALIYNYDMDQLTSGTTTWYNEMGSSTSVTMAVNNTTYPAVQQVLQGVKATDYAPATRIWTFDSAVNNYTTFERTPQVDGVFAAKSTALIGSKIRQAYPFPSTTALFAINSNVGSADLIGGGAPTSGGSGTVLQNNTFCFDGVRYYDYTIGNTMSALRDFTIEMDFTVTGSNDGYLGLFANKTTWSTMCVCMQWRRNGYRVSMFWNDYFDNKYGGDEHPEWINDGVYHHVAMVRSGTDVKLYCDGTMLASYEGASKALNLSIENLLSIGTQHVENAIFPGRMKHFQITPSAIYTENFAGDLPPWVGQ